MKTDLQGPLRVRFAPSPTGYLHVGGARTAIYNELLRQSLGGAHILRIEDTDRARSSEAMIEQIQSSLVWLGVQWDEGPFLQSESLEKHRAYGRQLLDAGQAYRCFCTAEELEELRREAVATGTAIRPRRHLDEADWRPRVEAGEPFVVRFLMPDEPIRYHDLLHGDMEVPPEGLEDFVLLRSDGTPTYHMSAVCDDIDTGVSLVMRGEDHLMNAAKHVPLFLALSGRLPIFAHLPLILGTDKKRLSKRTGATSVEEFRDAGYLPQALYNYLALLGWSPGGDRELMTREEMIELFTAERLNNSPAVFDPDKLSWVNAQYMSSLPMDELMPHLEPFLEAVGLGGLEGEAVQRLTTAVELHRTRAHTLRELAPMLLPYFQDRLEYDPERCLKFRKQPQMPAMLEELERRYAALEDFEIDPLDAALRELAAEQEVKAGVLIHPVRMALSAAKAGPPLFDLVAVMGREATSRHLHNFIEFLRAHPVAADAAAG